jgi:hypothetical protein
MSPALILIPFGDIAVQRRKEGEQDSFTYQMKHETNSKNILSPSPPLLLLITLAPPGVSSGATPPYTSSSGLPGRSGRDESMIPVELMIPCYEM